jgi:hypothetical protein
LDGVATGGFLACPGGRGFPAGVGVVSHGDSWEEGGGLRGGLCGYAVRWGRWERCEGWERLEAARSGVWSGEGVSVRERARNRRAVF